MGQSEEFSIGLPVCLLDGRTGVVQFIGQTQFAPGDWVGIVLDSADGKNDGSVQGQRYFRCRPNYGMFVRPSALVASTPGRPPQSSAQRQGTDGRRPASSQRASQVHSSMSVHSANRGPASSRGSVANKRQSIADATALERQSINAASPTPSSTRSSRIMMSPSRSPDRDLASISSAKMILDSGRHSRASSTLSNRVSMGPPPLPNPMKLTSLQSYGRVARGPEFERGQASERQVKTSIQSNDERPPRPESQSSQISRSTKDPIRSVAVSSQASLPSPSIRDNATESQDGNDTHEFSEKGAHPITVKDTTHPSSSRGSVAPTAQDAIMKKQVEGLQAKVRFLEKKRLDDREKLKTADKLRADRDRFEGIIQKLQSKYQPQQTELAAVQKQLSDCQTHQQELETKIAEADSIQEMVTLDREMAEETAESLKAEVDTLRAKHEEAELELSILREENEELSKEIGPEEKMSQGYLQLEKSNARLREALLRLRDVSQEQESSLKQQIAELEGDVEELGSTRKNLCEKQQETEKASQTIAELRGQLEAALGAEDMIEELSDKNMLLNEKIDEMRITVEDLESLRELNDELELNHIENEKQLQREIDFHDSLLNEEMARTVAQGNTIQDLELTITRFRELVSTMQSDLADMRAYKQISDAEASELDDRTRAMMEMNLQLQMNATKTKSRVVDQELNRLKSVEALEHLSMLQPLLPDTLSRDMKAIRAFLLLRRLRGKALLLHNHVKDFQGASATRLDDESEEMFLRVDILNRLVWVACAFDQLIGSFEFGELEQFQKLVSIAIELEPVEKTLDNYIHDLQKNEIRIRDCAEALGRNIALLTHLLELHVPNDQGQFGHRLGATAFQTQNYIDNSVESLSRIRTLMENQIANGNDAAPHAQQACQRLDEIISASRNAKVIVGKLVRKLNELNEQQMVLDISRAADQDRLSQDSISFMEDVQKLGRGVIQCCASVDVSAALLALFECDEYNPNRSESVLSSLASKQSTLIGSIHAILDLTNNNVNIISLSQDGMQSVTPWLQLAKNLQTENAAATAREAQHRELKREVQERNATLSMREELLEEMTVKVEVLEKRVGEGSRYREKARALEQDMEAAKLREQEHFVKLDDIRKELDRLTKDRDALQTFIESSGLGKSMHGQGNNGSTQADPRLSSVNLKRIEILDARIVALEATVRYLRSAYYSNVHIPRCHQYLTTPLTSTRKATSATQTADLKRTYMQQEGKAILKGLVDLISSPNAKPVKLSALPPPQDRGRWQPMREKSAYTVARQREEWEAWRGSGRHLTSFHDYIRPANHAHKLNFSTNDPNANVKEIESALSTGPVVILDTGSDS